MQEAGLSIQEIEHSLSTEQRRLLGIFVKELLAWNKRMNLTGLSSTQRIFDELVTDSLLPLDYFPETGTCLDVGSGAGFPAVPLAICRPGIRFFLMEPNSKKGSFLKQIIRLCGLKRAKVIRERIEKPSKPLPFQKVDIITSRAMAPLPRLIGWCTPYLAPGGMMVAFLGNRFEEILKECDPLLKEKNLLIDSLKSYTLKGKKSERRLLILKKENKP
ncbi:MAG: 16S rRNA (guanine(527)-N(7))-methyltransferase RsmG [Deltaproteobacteria bacterium]|nr:16S rRNA (guanine(527)-N(7))-methyltransferase RsmG [Deltaproteobacteria bacterium]